MAVPARCDAGRWRAPGSIGSRSTTSWRRTSIGGWSTLSTSRTFPGARRTPATRPGCAGCWSTVCQRQHRRLQGSRAPGNSPRRALPSTLRVYLTAFPEARRAGKAHGSAQRAFSLRASPRIHTAGTGRSERNGYTTEIGSCLISSAGPCVELRPLAEALLDPPTNEEAECNDQATQSERAGRRSGGYWR